MPTGAVRSGSTTHRAHRPRAMHTDHVPRTRSRTQSRGTTPPPAHPRPARSSCCVESVAAVTWCTCPFHYVTARCSSCCVESNQEWQQAVILRYGTLQLVLRRVQPGVAAGGAHGSSVAPRGRGVCLARRRRLRPPRARSGRVEQLAARRRCGLWRCALRKAAPELNPLVTDGQVYSGSILDVT